MSYKRKILSFLFQNICYDEYTKRLEEKQKLKYLENKKSFLNEINTFCFKYISFTKIKPISLEGEGPTLNKHSLT